MLDEQEAPAAEAEDDAVDVGGDDAVDLADLGGEVQTADEPAVSAEELLDIPDAPEIPGREEHIEDVLGDAAGGADVPTEPATGGDAAALGEQAAAEDAGAADAEPPDASASEEAADVADAEPPDATASAEDDAPAEEDGADA